MTVIVKQKLKPELVWAQRERADCENDYWSFVSRSRSVTLNLSSSSMNHVRPDGQLIVLGLDHSGDQLSVRRAVIIPEVEDKAMVMRHFKWSTIGSNSALRDIWAVLGYIPEPALRAFYHAVLSDDSIMRPFYSAKASHHHHHDHVGGLLEHSHEVASTAVMLCMRHNLGPLSLALAFIGGLLHDIGKVHLYYNQEPGLGVCGQHEAYNLLILARPLEALRQASPKIFEALTGCLVAKVGQRSGQYPTETIVRMCDRLSAEVSNWRRAFENKPESFWYAKCANTDHIYKRLG